MQKGRNPTRELYGILGKMDNSSAILREWNSYFREQGMDASMERYPASTENLPERLSEMFHFDRRLYLVSDALGEAIIPLLDAVDALAQNKVNVVVNKNGIMTGYYKESPSPLTLIEKDPRGVT